MWKDLNKMRKLIKRKIEKKREVRLANFRAVNGFVFNSILSKMLVLYEQSVQKNQIIKLVLN